MGITLLAPDDQEDLPDEYSGMSYFQNLGAEEAALESLKDLQVSKLYDLVVWGSVDGEESVFHPATLILKEAEKLKQWLTNNEGWDDFDYGRDGFLQDLEEFITVMTFAASASYSFSLEYC